MSQSPSAVAHTHHDGETGGAVARKIHPRVEIDTSPPFASVEEAVTRFGGRGSWITPQHMLRPSSDRSNDEFDMARVEKQAAELEKNLIMKEQETLKVLKNLEAAKRIVEELKLNLMNEVSTFMDSPYLSTGAQMMSTNAKSVSSLSLCPSPSAGLILLELNQAKLSLNKTTIDLSVVRNSINSLSKKMNKNDVLCKKASEKPMPGLALSGENNHCAGLKPRGIKKAEADIIVGGHENYVNVSREEQELNFESDHFKYMAEAARYEVMKAMSEIELTKTCINIAEMRLVAAKKMEEAARAIEAVALAERRSNGKCFLQKTEGIAEEEHYCNKESVGAGVMHHINEGGEEEKVVKHRKKSQQKELCSMDGGCRNTRKISADKNFISRTRSEQDRIRDSSKYKFRNSHPSHRWDSPMLDGDESNLSKDEPNPVATFSIGDILSRKLILQDDIIVEKHVENHGKNQQVSLSQMFREQSGQILCPSTNGAREGSVDNRQFFAQRKKFGFIHVSFPLTRQSRKKKGGTLGI